MSQDIGMAGVGGAIRAAEEASLDPARGRELVILGYGRFLHLLA